MFLPIAIQAGLLLDLSDGVHPTQVFGWNGGVLSLPEGATHYGMVTEGSHFRLRPGMYFVLPSHATIFGRGSRGLVISRLGYAGLPQWGGPLEAQGRLRYIDGCSDTLLVCPPQRGDPCLNHLHIPPHTRQSAHTHPSERVGVILRGAGECRTEGGVFALAPGMGWRIPAGCLHSFFTTASSLAPGLGLRPHARQPPDGQPDPGGRRFRCPTSRHPDRGGDPLTKGRLT